MAKGFEVREAVYFISKTNDIFKLEKETQYNQLILVRLTGKYRNKVIVPASRLSEQYRKIKKDWIIEHYPDIKL